MCAASDFSETVGTVKSGEGWRANESNECVFECEREKLRLGEGKKARERVPPLSTLKLSEMRLARRSVGKFFLLLVQHPSTLLNSLQLLSTPLCFALLSNICRNVASLAK